MASANQWMVWLVPVVFLLLVFTAFQDVIQPWLDDIVGGGPKSVALSIIFIIALVVGIGLAMALRGEKLSLKSFGKRITVLAVLFVMAWAVNAYGAICAV